MYAVCPQRGLALHQAQAMYWVPDSSARAAPVARPGTRSGLCLHGALHVVLLFLARCERSCSTRRAASVPAPPGALHVVLLFLARCERSRSTRRVACGPDTLVGMHVFLVHGALYRCVRPTGRTEGGPSRRARWGSQP